VRSRRSSMRRARRRSSHPQRHRGHSPVRLSSARSAFGPGKRSCSPFIGASFPTCSLGISESGQARDSNGRRSMKRATFMRQPRNCSRRATRWFAITPICRTMLGSVVAGKQVRFSAAHGARHSGCDRRASRRLGHLDGTWPDIDCDLYVLPPQAYGRPARVLTASTSISSGWRHSTAARRAR